MDQYECNCEHCPLIDDAYQGVDREETFKILKPVCGFLIASDDACSLLIQTDPVTGPFTVQEIAEAMGVSDRKVRYLEKKALKKLKKEIDIEDLSLG